MNVVRPDLALLLLTTLSYATLASAYLPIKFRQWYPAAARRMAKAADACPDELEAYWNQEQIRPPYSQCGLAQDCLLANLPEYSKANYAAATILLGLMPTILGFVGPRLEDTAALMIRRPVITSLMMIGMPSISPIPLLSPMAHEKVTTSPSALMAKVKKLSSRSASGTESHKDLGPGRYTRRSAIMLSAMQYLLVLGALANNLLTSVELDYKSNIVWHCSSVGWPIAWIISATVIHWISALSLWSRVRTRDTSSPVLVGVASRVRRWAVRELEPSLFQAAPSWVKRIGPSTITSELLAWASSIMILVHYMVGTLVFSSWLYIGVPDATLIMARFGMSALVCRLILWFESASLRMQIRDDVGRTEVSQEMMPMVES